jgi:predicted site-specific integrase-resolvase
MAKELRAMAEVHSSEISDAAWPPAGFLTEAQAAARMGISDATLRAWLRKGRFGYAGGLMPAPNGRSRRVYAVAEVDRAYRAMKRAAGDAIESIDAANAWPPAGFVERDEVARRCGVVPSTIKVWARQGKLVGGRLAKKPGSRARITIYPEAEAHRLIDEIRAEAEAPFPPEGFVDRYQAAAMFGMHVSQFELWQRLGRIRCTSKTVRGPKGGPAKIYRIADLERAAAELAAEDAAAQKPPDGFLDIDGAAKFFDVHPVTLNNWQREGRLRGSWHDLPGGRGRRRVYDIAELDRARVQMAAEAARPTAPQGFIELHEAARVLGVSVGTILKWEKHGEVAAGQVVPIPGTSARTKIYPIAETERLREEIRKASENFPPKGWVEMNEAARLANVSVQVWKKWLAEGRVENWRWARRPTMARCKLFSVEEIERIVAERGRDHAFFLEPDARGGYSLPKGYVGREEAADLLGIAVRTFIQWQSMGRIACGRWARAPVGEGMGCGGRRVYPVDELRRRMEALAGASDPYVDPSDPGVMRVPVMSWDEPGLEAVIDAADLVRIEGMRWWWTRRHVAGMNEVVRSAPAGAQLPLPRVLLGLQGPRWKINYLNRDPLDCRRANLVVRTMDAVIQGQRKRRLTHFGRPPTSRFKGVCWDETIGKWRAHIQKQGIGRRLGCFDDEIAAAEAYDEAASEMFGEHARLNFPDGIDAWLERQGTSDRAAA